MSVSLRAKTVAITTKRKVGDVALTGALSTGGIPCDTGSQKEQAARGARKSINEGDHVAPPPVPILVEESTLTLKNLKKLGRRDPLAAALAALHMPLLPDLQMKRGYDQR